jgi:hypothetical protein
MEVSNEIEKELMKLKNTTASKSENSSLKSGNQPPNRQA